MKKVLVLGGTKYLGLEFIKLLNNSRIDLFVASRKKIDIENFIEIDRKNQEDLNQLFRDNQFDVIVDFINYSGFDSEILINSLKQQEITPKLILISTVYTYSLPLELNCDSVYDETSFNPLNFKYSLNDRPQLSYADGKRNMESYCTENYRNDKLVILRFPIILGYNDYTERTHFYIDKIKNNLKVNPKYVDKKASYIFSIEAAFAIYNFVISDYYGIYNVSLEPISESDLIKMYCKHYHSRINYVLDNDLEFTNTPFTSKFDFIINSNKYNQIFPLDIGFEEALTRELSKM
jgi:nucleoside-diphosphate-sugar epimerase